MRMLTATPCGWPCEARCVSGHHRRLRARRGGIYRGRAPIAQGRGASYLLALLQLVGDVLGEDIVQQPPVLVVSVVPVGPLPLVHGGVEPLVDEVLLHVPRGDLRLRHISL
eukprot:1123136-Prorocentrum_minimum.AAC.4